ncbi:hypothetical protein SDC9_211744 [bioreactor metagenome]|uniref:NodB homology domain-containing protein n=1 Tax=bioreactor metagenome TaxID=1076179 RepID=A0A645JJY8_9ZZZZ
MEFLKTMRIKKEMTRAACDGRVYHLWCHPHNFGSNVEQSLSGFEEILKHFEYLHRKYAFLSLSMEECAELPDKLGG